MNLFKNGYRPNWPDPDAASFQAYYAIYQTNLDRDICNERVARDLKFREMSRAIKQFGVDVGTSVLDVGCGVGHLLDSFSAFPSVRTFLGLEYDLTKASMARALYPGLDIIAGEGEAIPLPSGAVDTVVFADVVEHVLKPERFLQECVRIARRQVIMIVPLERNPETYLRLFRLKRSGAQNASNNALAVVGGHINYWNWFTFRSFLRRCLAEMEPTVQQASICTDDPFSPVYTDLAFPLKKRGKRVWLGYQLHLLWRRFAYLLCGCNPRLHSSLSHQTGVFVVLKLKRDRYALH